MLGHAGFCYEQRDSRVTTRCNVSQFLEQRITARSSFGDTGIFEMFEGFMNIYSYNIHINIYYLMYCLL